MSRLRPIERRVERFSREPVSVRNALSVIVVATTLVVVGSALLMRLLDASEYSDYGRGLWWAIQTVTTVGYGDVTPVHASGRLVGTGVMLWGTAYLAILTATITSTFVARAQRDREAQSDTRELAAEERTEARLAELDARLERIEQSLARLAGD